MKNINLDWQDLTEENMTKIYLYGDLKIKGTDKGDWQDYF